MATFKHISSKNADYGAAEQYLTFEHDEFTMKPTLDENGRLMLREDYLAISSAPVIRWNDSSVTSSGDARSARVILQQPIAMAFAA